MVSQLIHRSVAGSVSIQLRSESLLSTVADGGTFTLVVLAPLWMGGRHPLGRFLFVALICLVVVSTLWQRVAARQRIWYVTGSEWLLAASFGVILLQLLPLPHSLLTTISPALSERLPLWTSSAASNLGLGSWDTISLHPDMTRHGLAMFTAYALLFVITAQRLRDASDVGRLMRWVALAAVLMAVVGLAQLVFGNGKFLWIYDHPTREALRVVRGAFANQNHMAHLLALGVAPLVWWLASCAERSGGVGGEESRRLSQFVRGTRGRHDRSLLLLGTGLGLVLLAGVLTFSRAGVVLLVLAGLLATAVLIWTGRLTRRGWIIASLLLGVVTLAVASYGVGPLSSRLDALLAAESLGDLSAGRELVWSAVRQSIQQFPLLGTGVGTHQDVYPMFLRDYSSVAFPYAESGYLQVLEELGVVGLSLLLVGLGMVGNWCRLALVRAETKELRLMAGAITASLVISMLHSLVDFVWYIPACMTLTVILIAGIWRLSRITSQLATQREKVRVARPLLMAGSFGSCVVTMLLLVLSSGPARAARSWDEVARITHALERSPAAGIDSTAHDEAIVDQLSTCLEESVRVSPRDARAHARLAAVYLQKFELAQRRATNSMSLIQIRDAAFASEFPSLKQQDQWLDRAVPENRHLLDQALRHARTALRLAPLQGEAYLYLAELGFLAGDGVRAKRAYLDQAMRVRPYDDDVLMVVASELALDGQLQQATVHWKQVFEHSPHYRQPIIELFAAQVPADEFLKRFQPDLSGAILLFDHYRRIGFAPQAGVAGRYLLSQLNRQLQQDGKALDSDQWFQAFVVQDYLSDEEAALSCLQNAVQLGPERFVYRQKLARYLLRQRHYNEALVHLRWCLQRKPHDESLLRDLQTASRSDLVKPALTR